MSRIHAEWAILVSQSYRLNDDAFRSEALDFAVQIMRRIRECFLRIIDQLTKEKYRFIDSNQVIVGPQPGVSDWVGECNNNGIYIPLSLEAWLRVVGNINLMGTHPGWTKLAYADGNVVAAENVLYTDPLVVELTEDYLRYLYEEWRNFADSSESHLKPPFRMEISPDHLHKANVSGGLPYELDADRPAVDSILLNERHSTTFVGYIRSALAWKGFPGFEYIETGERQGWEKDKYPIV